MEVVRKMEQHGSKAGKPSKRVEIANCGALDDAEELRKIEVAKQEKLKEAEERAAGAP